MTLPRHTFRHLRALVWSLLGGRCEVSRGGPDRSASRHLALPRAASRRLAPPRVPSGRSVKQHEVQLAATLYTPVDETSIPTGEVRAVGGAMDLTSPTPIGKGLAQADGGMGYDHNYVLTSPPRQDGLRACGRVYEPTSGRCMTVTTDQPGVQFYTAGYLDGSLEGRGGAKYHKFAGFCLETQHFPDSVNRPHFPPIWLRPGEVYKHVTEHEFGVLE